MTVISSLFSPHLIKKLAVKWIVIISIALTVCGLLGFSLLVNISICLFGQSLMA